MSDNWGRQCQYTIKVVGYYVSISENKKNQAKRVMVSEIKKLKINCHGEMMMDGEWTLKED